MLWEDFRTYAQQHKDYPSRKITYIYAIEFIHNDLWFVKIGCGNPLRISYMEKQIKKRLGRESVSRTFICLTKDRKLEYKLHKLFKDRRFSLRTKTGKLFSGHSEVFLLGLDELIISANKVFDECNCLTQTIENAEAIRKINRCGSLTVEDSKKAIVIAPDKTEVAVESFVYKGQRKIWGSKTFTFEDYFQNHLTNKTQSPELKPIASS